ncbi:MAG: L-aspartate oxidase [Acidimicrobiia bacterium]
MDDVSAPVDLLVLGSGVAGLSAAVRAADAGLSVILVTKADLGESTTRYAQGGISAAMEEPDSPELHVADTVGAGAGLCDLDATRILAVEGPQRIRELIDLGASFDPLSPGDTGFDRGREGGHSVRRVLHAGGDATGAEVERALVAATRARSADVRESWFATDLLVDGGRCVGVAALDADGAAHRIRARHTLLATGGIGALYAVTTNPALATGDGLAMAWRAGATLCDIEFVQFHPTALHHPVMPRPLLSEALRGEGARLRTESGGFLMDDVHPLGDLAPRDVVATAIAARIAEAGVDHLWLDATGVPDVERRFPTLVASCRSVGLDPTSDWLPVAPAAHYHCGGVAVDVDGASTLPGLWACGEAAASGVHGANRLASNSLLDGLVFSARCIEAVASGRDAAEPTGVLRGAPRHMPGPVVDGDPGAGGPELDAIRSAMTRGAGVVRSAESLDAVAEVLGATGVAATVPRSERADRPIDVRHDAELANVRTTASLLVTSARRREESRGTHQRSDHPETRDAWAGRLFVTAGRDPEYVPLPPTPTPPPRPSRSGP